MIRAAAASDTATIAQLIRELADYERLSHEVRLSERDLEVHLFGEKPYAEVAIAEEDGETIGFALFFHSYSTFDSAPGLYLEDIFVQPEHRGRGHGKALLRHMAQLAVERRCSRMEWRVLDWNEPSIAFYRSLGAVALDDWTTYRLTTDAIVALAASYDSATQPTASHQ
jgi:GNAT superfamily N-acetyltransferase